jgi:catechol 2,3-dioxygenase-like lactoylglutathione lyase family enzyme
VTAAPRAHDVHHLAIATANPEGLAEFYEHVLGLAVRSRQDDGHGVRSVWLELGAAALLMLERGDPQRSAPQAEANAPTSFAEKRPGFHLLALAIERRERAAWRARLEANGVHVEHESEHSLYFRDPDGNRLALSHYPD